MAYGVTLQETVVLWYGGLRGAIGLALGLLTKLQDLGDSQSSNYKYMYLCFFCFCF